MNIHSSFDPVVRSNAFSHGTLETAGLDRTGPFYEEFLGIGWYRQARVAGGFNSGSTKWYVACLGLPTGVEVAQSRDYRWVLALGSDEEICDARQKALEKRELYGIQEITDICENRFGGVSFVLQDLNGCWWEFEHRTTFCYDDLFAAGDVV
ncbi:hypothetical protein [Sphingomonas sp.]|uniref:hypothetical protein n=1 Tax=Sphingomonas sp. TaxID=28214 RepID=UPI0025E03254|nr:hypothetical protein [Sphingomonas sp.]